MLWLNSVSKTNSLNPFTYPVRPFPKENASVAFAITMIAVVIHYNNILK